MSFNTITINARPSFIEHSNAKCNNCGKWVCLYHTHQCPQCGSSQFVPLSYTDSKGNVVPMFVTKVDIKMKNSDKDNASYQSTLQRMVAAKKNPNTMLMKLVLFGNQPIDGTPFAQPHPLAPYIVYGREISLRHHIDSIPVLHQFHSKRYNTSMVEWEMVLDSRDDISLSHTLEEFNKMTKLLPLPNVDQNGKKIFPNPLTTQPIPPVHPGGNTNIQVQVPQGVVTPQMGYGQPSQQFWGQTPQVGQPAMVQGAPTIPMPQPQEPVMMTKQPQGPAVNNMDESNIEDPFASC